MLGTARSVTLAMMGPPEAISLSLLPISPGRWRAGKHSEASIPTPTVPDAEDLDDSGALPVRHDVVADDKPATARQGAGRSAIRIFGKELLHPLQV
ncbi:MAG: hypothetical protein WDN69_31110 [Aliidongia sp.]